MHALNYVRIDKTRKIMIQLLVIDDEDPIRKLLSRMIELEGYKVFQAADCQSALKQLKQHAVDVVLCDVFLPDGNGVDKAQLNQFFCGILSHVTRT